MAESGDWISNAAESARSYVSELASDIWHGEFEKHPIAMEVGWAAASMLTVGGVLGMAHRADRIARAGMSARAAAGGFVEADGIASAGIGAETAKAGELAAKPAAASLYERLMSNEPLTARITGDPASSTGLYEKIMGTGGAEVDVAAPLSRSFKIQADSAAAKELVEQKARGLRLLGARADLTPEQFTKQLGTLFRSTLRQVDADTTLARSRRDLYPGHTQIADTVVRADEGVALERVVSRVGKEDILGAIRHYDFNTGESVFYDYGAAQNAVLRSTVTPGGIRGSLLSRDQASEQVSPLISRLFHLSAQRHYIEGFHELI